MNFHILTLFPEMVENGLKTSILGRAVEAGYINIKAVNIRDYTKNKHNKVDDYPYGGGAGMLMQAQPVYDAYNAVTKELISSSKSRVIYLTPQGKVFTQSMAQELAKEENLVLLCGHYEGIDERVLEEIVTDEISIGDYVLTGGELGAMVLVDAIARLVPGVLNNEESANTESFHNHLLEYPQYSRPPVWHEKEVPQVLLSGNHKAIHQWRLDASCERTQKKRPDLYNKYKNTLAAIELLYKEKLLNMDMIEPLRLGNAEILYFENDGILIKETKSDVYFLSAFGNSKSLDILKQLPKKEYEKMELLVIHKEEEIQEFIHTDEFEELITCYQSVYTRGVPLSMNKEVRIMRLSVDYLDKLKAMYHMQMEEEYLLKRLKEGSVYGAYVNETLAGFIGAHAEGSIGMLEVFPEYQRQGIGFELEKYMVNKYLQEGKIPFGQVEESNVKSIKLQEKLGFRISTKKLCWLVKKTT